MRRLWAMIKKNLFVIITLTLTAGTMLVLLFTTDDVASLGQIIMTLQPGWLLLALATAVCGWLLEGYVLGLFSKHVCPTWTFGRAFSIGMTGLLYSALTPFSTGGQPMQIYNMKKMGMDTGKAGSVVALKTVVYQIVMVAYFLVLVAVKLPFFQRNVSDFSFLTIIGLISNTIFITLILLFILCENTINKILCGVINFLHRVHLCKDPETRYKKIYSQFSVC